MIDHWFNESVPGSWKDEGGTIKVQVNSISAHTRLMTIANHALREAKLEIMTNLESLRNSVLKKLAIAVTSYMSEETPDPPNLDGGGSASMAASQLTATPSPPSSEIASGDPVSISKRNSYTAPRSPTQNVQSYHESTAGYIHSNHGSNPHPPVDPNLAVEPGVVVSADRSNSFNPSSSGEWLADSRAGLEDAVID